MAEEEEDNYEDKIILDHSADEITTPEADELIKTLEEKLGLQGGYRVIINQGEDGGQTVHHLHVHLLGGEKLKDF